MKARYILIAGLALVAFGCGITVVDDARRQMGYSQSVYEQCLQLDRTDTAGCEGYKQIYQADLKAYRKASDENTFTAAVTAGCPPLYAVVDATNSKPSQTSN